MLLQFRTVKTYGEAIYEINKSTFISYVKRVSSEEEAISFINTIKKKHWDATHNCSAYVIGDNDQYQKADDDGEPSGTAGKPILEIIKKNRLKNTVIVVTRYFGGIKLGAGGLVRAYGKAASIGLEQTGIVSKILHTAFKIIIDYHLLGSVENNLRQQNYIIEDKSFTDKVALIILVPCSEEEKLHEMLLETTSALINIEEVTKKYVELPLETIAI